MQKNGKIIIGTIVVVATAVAIGYNYMQSTFGVQGKSVDSIAQENKISEYHNPQSVIGVDELNTKISNGDLTNGDLVVIGSLDPKGMATGIEGSHTVWRPDYSASNGDFGGMRNTDEEMAALLGSYGATTESTIVVYASNSHHDATRLWWQIKLLGHQDVRVLDGGLNAWIGAKLPTGGPISIDATVYPTTNVNHSSIADLQMVLDAIGNDEYIIIDTRSEGENQGTETASGAFGPGTIPGSEFITWTSANNEDTTFKSYEELSAIYKDKIEGKKVITFCQSGVRSAHTLFVLTELLGEENVYNYDGSWIEYSYEYYELKSDISIENGKER